jgi:uncharacterized membrane protein YoaK (UPF0700 family)
MRLAPFAAGDWAGRFAGTGEARFHAIMADHPSTKFPAALPRLLLVALVLAFVGGYADASSYVLTRSFTGHITGNTVLFAVNLGRGAWGDAWTCALAVVAFLAGVLAAELAGPNGGVGAKREEVRSLRWPILAEGALLGAAIGCRAEVNSGLGAVGCILLACAALGIQNKALQRCGRVSVHTTFITGMVTTLVTSIARVSQDPVEVEEKEDTVGTLLTVWAAFVLGAGAGGALTYRFQLGGFAGILVPLGVAGVLSWIG